MSRWCAKSLGDPLTAGEPMARIEELFRAAFARAGGPSDMAIFVRHESEGRLHCDVRAYFSPAASEVARAVQAAPCDQPAPDGLSLLAGAHEAWPALFPDRPGGCAA
ncbi:MAG TPA: hypothetical protein VIE44_09820 [Methylomirabilota bacterium]|jgi:hypothetical protein